MCCNEWPSRTPFVYSPLIRPILSYPILYIHPTSCFVYAVHPICNQGDLFEFSPSPPSFSFGSLSLSFSLLSVLNLSLFFISGSWDVFVLWDWSRFGDAWYVLPVQWGPWGRSFLRLCLFKKVSLLSHYMQDRVFMSGRVGSPSMVTVFFILAGRRSARTTKKRRDSSRSNVLAPVQKMKGHKPWAIACTTVPVVGLLVLFFGFSVFSCCCGEAGLYLTFLARWHFNVFLSFFSLVSTLGATGNQCLFSTHFSNSAKMSIHGYSNELRDKQYGECQQHYTWRAYALRSLDPPEC